RDAAHPVAALLRPSVRVLFSAEERDRLREQIIAAARADKRITGAAITGSAALGNQDEWSDIDLFFGIVSEDQLPGALSDMTDLMYSEHGALHHFDVVAGPATYRVFRSEEHTSELQSRFD